MKCTTKAQALRVAGYGANKMTAEGYELDAISPEAGLYQISKPGTVRPYFVQIDAEMLEFVNGQFCDCAFAVENKEFGTCKHRVWVERKVAERAAELEAEQTAQVLRAYRANQAAAKVGAGVWDTTTAAERMQTAHNESREMAWFANTFNDRIY